MPLMLWTGLWTSARPREVRSKKNSKRCMRIGNPMWVRSVRLNWWSHLSARLHALRPIQRARRNWHTRCVGSWHNRRDIGGMRFMAKFSWDTRYNQR